MLSDDEWKDLITEKLDEKNLIIDEKETEILGLRQRIEILQAEKQELLSTNRYLRNRTYGASDEVN